jgi:DNA-binding CsgD family transcriptional regulator
VLLPIARETATLLAMNAPLQTDAILQMIQPGGRNSYRRRLLDALRAVVPAKAAFFFFGRDLAHAYADGSILRHDRLVSLDVADIPLSDAFGFDARSVVETSRRVYLANELFPQHIRNTLPYFKSHGEGVADVLLVFLHEGGVLFGLVGLERLADEPPFEPSDAEKLEALGPFLMAGARAQLTYEELSRETSALRVLGKMSGSLFVIDRDRKRVLWAANRDSGLEWTTDVLPQEAQLVSAAEAMMQAKAKGEALPTPPRLEFGSVHSVARLEDDPVFGSARCVVLRVVPNEQAKDAMEGLSKREREIARLLVAGYSGVNVAAISGLSENTVRTYVRRLYAKLEVSNRADLVRKLMTPEPAAKSAVSSALAPTPDSSLAYGDEMLD